MISILLGLGLATLFRKVCTDKNCIRFNGPVITDIQDKTYKHGEKCYQYTSTATKCDPTKKVMDMSVETTNGDMPNVPNASLVNPTTPAQSSMFNLFA